MSKAALDALTKSLALEFGERKIRVNSVNPTVILTRMGRENWSDEAKARPLLEKIPLGRFGEVKEVVDVVVWLLSEGKLKIIFEILSEIEFFCFRIELH